MTNRRTPDSTRKPKPAGAAPAKATPTAAGATPTAKTQAPTAIDTVPAAQADATPAKPTKAARAKRAAKTKSARSGDTGAGPQVSEETRRAMIAESAYLRAERRGFAPGAEVEDWCEAEKEVDALLNAKMGAGPQ